MADTKLTFFLVHGSWMDGSAWDGVAGHLRSAGHDVHTPTLAGHGPGAERQVSHAAIIAGLKDEMEQGGLSDLVVVGHSFGGTVVQQLAIACTERIRRLVFWNAFVVPHGESLNDQIPAHYVAMFEGLAQSSQDHTVILPYPLYREAFINDGDGALARSTYDGLMPEYLGLFEEKLDTAAFFDLPIPKSYVYSWDDASLPHGEATGWYPRFGNRLGMFRYASMPGGHMAHWTKPAELAAKLIEAARD